MRFLEDVRRGARAVAKEAETRTQLALKHAEAANLRSAIRESLAEAGREMLAAYERRASTDEAAVTVNDRARALFDEARRLEGELDRVRGEIERLRAASLFAKDEGGAGADGSEEGKADGAPRP